jgi:hypothetical protein
LRDSDIGLNQSVIIMNGGHVCCAIGVLLREEYWSSVGWGGALVVQNVRTVVSRERVVTERPSGRRIVRHGRGFCFLTVDARALGWWLGGRTTDGN